MILGERHEFSTPQPVEAAIADVRHERGTGLAQQQCDDGRPHSLERPVLAREFVDLEVGSLDGVLQTRTWIPVCFTKQLAEGPDGHPARNLTALVPAHPVRDHQENLAALGIIETIEGILVDLADPSDVSRTGDRELEFAPALSSVFHRLHDRQEVPSLFDRPGSRSRPSVGVCSPNRHAHK